jgi:septum site-determining protein MinC
MSNPFNEDDGLQGNPSCPPPLSDSLPPSNSSLTSNSEGAPSSRRIEDRNNVITARGTSEGLVLRIDGRVETEDLVGAVREFLSSRRSFLSGNDVAFEWIGRRPEEIVIQTVTGILSHEFSVSVRASKLKNVTAQKTPIAEPLGAPDEAAGRESVFSVVGGGKAIPIKRASTPAEKGVSLFDGIDTYDARGGASSPMSWDEPDARIVYGTLRSGQKIETEHSIVVFGDVNSGAEVIAGGDVVILGTLRGIAHAGAYDESGGGRVILSLNLRPTQLRIGLVISRGSGADDAESTPRGGLPEVARVDGNTIVVEPYQSRTVWVRRRE